MILVVNSPTAERPSHSEQHAVDALLLEMLEMQPNTGCWRCKPRLLQG
jgi:hypothetical protein